MNTTAMDERPAGQIEAEIAATRQSLDRKLQELDRRLNPSYRWTDLKARLETVPGTAAAWGAVAAIAAGTWMAASGLRRARAGNGHAVTDFSSAPEASGIIICE